MIWSRALFLGDSLTYGSRDPFGLAWPYYLAQIALREDDYCLIPELCATPGWRVSDLWRGWSGRVSDDVSEAFILIGTNDAKTPVPHDLYVESVRCIESQLSAQNVRTYVLTIPLPFGFGSPGYSSSLVRTIRTYNDVLRDTFSRVIECEDVRETIDGVHLLPVGSREVAKRVWSAIKSERSFT